MFRLGVPVALSIELGTTVLLPSAVTSDAISCVPQRAALRPVIRGKR